ncbi:MAG: hypothetical protein LC437_09055 [Thiohalomonas sp.]|nr:hypothetical protein [Thiohalomonas sp.]
MFEELLAHQLTMKPAYQHQMQHYSYPFTFADKTEKLQYSAQFLKQLPFKLTKAQLRVIAEIAADLSQPHPMQRLIQGDVGSGKTVLAAMSPLFSIENGFQVALMAPTSY